MNNSLAIERPSLAWLGTEPLRAAWQFACNKLGESGAGTPGYGHPVVIFPGLGADGSAVATLRKHCRSLGYEAFDWGQVFNTGPPGDVGTGCTLALPDQRGAPPTPKPVPRKGPNDPAVASPRDTMAPRSPPGLALPHERDEAPEATAAVPDSVVSQAKRDIEAGMVDTDMRATPGLDAELRERLVPGPGGKPPSSVRQ